MTRILRVMHVITGLGQGGAESVLFRLATWPDQRVRHSVISLTDEGVYGTRLRAAGVPVHALGMPRGRVTLGGLLALRALLRRERPDAVQTWMYHADLIGGVYAAGRHPRGRMGSAIPANISIAAAVPRGWCSSCARGCRRACRRPSCARRRMRLRATGSMATTARAWW